MLPGRVLVTGISGPIGKELVPSLKRAGSNVVRLTRGRAGGEDKISWDPSNPIPPRDVPGFDAVVHLAGKTIVGRWTADKKARIRDSRILGTRHLAEALSRAEKPPQ